MTALNYTHEYQRDHWNRHFRMSCILGLCMQHQTTEDTDG